MSMQLPSVNKMKQCDCRILTISCSCWVFPFVGFWMTGTCGEDVVSCLSLGASHSVMTSTSSSDGVSLLASFGEEGSPELWALCRIRPECNFNCLVNFTATMNIECVTRLGRHLRRCTQRFHGRGHRGSAHPSHGHRFGRPVGGP